MPFETKIISDRKEHEPINRSLGKAMRELKQMVPGQATLATVEPVAEQDEPAIVLVTAEELKEKAAIINLLLTLIDPPVLSRKRPNPVTDKLSFAAKVKGMSLNELRRFMSEGINPLAIDPDKASEEFKEELTRKYKDLSP